MRERDDARDKFDKIKKEAKGIMNRYADAAVKRDHYLLMAKDDAEKAEAEVKSLKKRLADEEELLQVFFSIFLTPP